MQALVELHPGPTGVMAKTETPVAGVEAMV
jgi:hypothetical protein